MDVSRIYIERQLFLLKGPHVPALFLYPIVSFIEKRLSCFLESFTTCWRKS